MVCAEPALVDLQQISDERGTICIATVGTELPFTPCRVFLLHNSRASNLRRGGHAHREQAQFLLCVAGKIEVATDNDRHYWLSENDPRGLHVPAMTWLDIDMMPFSRLAVFAPEPYDEADYIRDRATFSAMKRG